MANDQALHNAGELGNAELLLELIADANRAEATQDGFHRAHQAAHQFYLEKKADRDRVVRNHQLHGQGVPAAQMAALDSAVERADFERKSAYDDATRHSKAVAVPAKVLLRDAEHYLNTNAQHLRVVLPPDLNNGGRK